MQKQSRKVILKKYVNFLFSCFLITGLIMLSGLQFKGWFGAPLKVEASENTIVNVNIPAEIKISGNPPAGSIAVYTLQLITDRGGNHMPDDAELKFTESGTACFGPINFSAPGNYYYQIKQLDDAISGCSLDPSIYHIEVSVFSNNSGVLTSSICMCRNNDTGKMNSASFTNVYSTETPSSDIQREDTERNQEKNDFYATPVKTGDLQPISEMLIMLSLSFVIVFVICLRKLRDRSKS